MFHWGAISWGIHLVTLGFGGVILAKKMLDGVYRYLAKNGRYGA